MSRVNIPSVSLEAFGASSRRLPLRAFNAFLLIVIMLAG